jgi:hypothetical protein
MVTASIRKSRYFDDCPALVVNESEPEKDAEKEEGQHEKTETDRLCNPHGPNTAEHTYLCRLCPLLGVYGHSISESALRFVVVVHTESGMNLWKSFTAA